MKRSILLGRYVVALVLAAAIFQTGCTKEKGYHDVEQVSNLGNLNTYQYLKSKTGIYVPLEQDL